MRKFVFLLAVLLCTSTAFAGSLKVKKSDYAKEWCFSFNEGELLCDAGAVFIEAGSVKYALNGTAKSRSKEGGKYKKGYADASTAQTQGGDLFFFLEKGKSLCK